MSDHTVLQFMRTQLANNRNFTDGGGGDKTVDREQQLCSVYHIYSISILEFSETQVGHDGNILSQA